MGTKNQKKEKTWQKIGEMMQIHKYNYTAEQCEGRWKTLVRGVKKVSDHNSKSGNNLKTHPYEEQLDFILECLMFDRHMCLTALKI